MTTETNSITGETRTRLTYTQLGEIMLKAFGVEACQKAAEDAKLCAGGYGPEIREEVIQIFASAIEFNPKLNHAAAQSGLAKLTDEERAALGL